MSASIRYGLASAILITLITLGIWPFLEPAGRTGVLVAGAIAVPVQSGAFAALVRYRGRAKGFMAAWAGGMALRASVLVLVAFMVIRSDAQTAIPMLLALAGFFFVLLLLEPIYFRIDPEKVA